MINREFITNIQSFKTEGEYRESPSLNYSLLKNIPDGPFCLVEDKVNSFSDALYIGDYTDKYFTNREELSKIYYVSKTKTQLNDSLEALFNAFKIEKEYSPTIDRCVEKSREIGIYASIKDDNKLKSRITKDLFDRLDEEKESNGKIVLTQDQYVQALSAIHNIYMNPDAMQLLTESENQIVIYQFKWEFELELKSGNKRKFKVMYDALKFDLNKKRIIGIDIKTGAKPVHKFGEQFLDYGYDIQGQLYFLGMIALREKYFPDWELCHPNDFKFIYSQKKAERPSIVVLLSNEFIKSNKKFWNILDDVDWYIENQIFDSHRVIAQSRGILEIDKLLQ